MSKRRIVDARIRTSQTFAGLTYRQRDLWHGLIVVADDQGRLPGLPVFVRAQVWPFDDLPLDEVESDLQALVEAGNIVLYSPNGQRYAQIVNWWRYQQPQWAMPSDYPPPTGWVDRARYHAKGNAILTLNWGEPGGFPARPLPSPPAGELPSGLPSQLPSQDGSGQPYPIEKDKEEINDQDSESTAGAGAPPPSQPVPAGQGPGTPDQSPAASKRHYTVGQRRFLETFQAKQFKLTVQAEAVLALEQRYGTDRLLECAVWAAKKGLSVGDAIAAIETAIPKWGQPKARQGGGGTVPTRGREDPAELDAVERIIRAHHAKGAPSADVPHR